MSKPAYQDTISLYFHDAYTIKETTNSHGVDIITIEEIESGEKVEMISEAAWELREAMNRYIHWKQAQHREQTSKEQEEVSLKSW